MIEFRTPDTLNGEQLVEELRSVSIAIDDANNGTVVIDGNGKLWLDVSAEDALKAQEVVKNHKAIAKAELTIEQKLETVGLKIEDLKSALGL